MNPGYSLGVSNFRLRNSVGTLGAIALCLSQAVAGTSISREGINFQVIGSAGNRPIQAGEAESFRVGRGSVGYEYGLSTTEVTVSQYFQFVDAYGRVNQQYPDVSLLGRGIQLNSLAASGYSVTPSLMQYSATMSWRNAARMCNWLHNGRRNEKWAFESGAYDVSTFTANPNGTVNDQIARSAGAKFWIPSLDEWIKGAFYDPNRYGVSGDGYWQRPGGQNEYLVTGTPGLGGQTDAQWNPNPALAPFVPVGSYPQVQGPWGLLDVSGGEAEWTEARSGDSARQVLGSRRNDPFWALADSISWIGDTLEPDFFAGFRIATVPAPSSLAVFSMIVLFVRRRS